MEGRRIPARRACSRAWFCSFAGYAYVAWGPAFVQGYRGLSARQAGLALGSTLVVGGTSRIAAGAYLSDLLAKIRAWGRPIIIPIGFVLGAPAIYLALHSAGKLQFLHSFSISAWAHSSFPRTMGRCPRRSMISSRRTAAPPRWAFTTICL